MVHQNQEAIEFIRQVALCQRLRARSGGQAPSLPSSRYTLRFYLMFPTLNVNQKKRRQIGPAPLFVQSLVRTAQPLRKV